MLWSILNAAILASNNKPVVSTEVIISLTAVTHVMLVMSTIMFVLSGSKNSFI